jgi:hypothetical protein
MKHATMMAFVVLLASNACGGASSQPLTPDPDPTPTAQDIAALQNAQTSAADSTPDAGSAPTVDTPKSKSHKP